MKRKISLIVLSVFIVLMAAACAGKENASPKETTGSPEQTNAGEKKGTEEADGESSYLNLDSDLPIVNEQITLKVHVVENTAMPGYVEDKWFWKWAEERTNIKFDVTVTDVAAWPERINLLFASGDLPDIFLNNNFSNSQITRFGQSEKMFMPLNDLIEEYASNISQVFSESAESRAIVTSPDGNIYTLPSLHQLSYPITYEQRGFVNQKWLDNLNLQQPTNLDEFYDVLKAFKEQDPNQNGLQDEIPFTGAWGTGMAERTFFLTAFGLNASNNPSIYVEDGTVKLAEAEPVYEQYLQYVNKLYSEELLDKNIFTQTQVQQDSISSQDLAGYHFNGAPHVTTPNWKDYASVKPLVSQWNSKPTWPDRQGNVAGKFAISKDSKYSKAAIRFADLFFTKKYAYNLWGGPMVGSEDTLDYPYAGWVIDEKGANLFPNMAPGTSSVWDMINHLIPINGNPLGLTLSTDDLSEMAGKKLSASEPDVFWQNSYEEIVAPYLQLQFPNLYMTDEQEKRIAELKTGIEDFTKTMEAKFIIGAEPLSEVPAYFEELKRLGVEEFIAIYQEAYDAYINSLQ